MAGTREPGIGLILGRRGTGKSRLARRLARYAGHTGRRVIVDDRMHDWQRWGFSAPNVLLFDNIEPDDLAEMAMSWAPCTLILDELATAIPLCTPKGPLHDLIFAGRHYCVALVGCAQRASLVSLDFRALWTWAAIFETTAARDLDWLAKNFDESVASEAKELRPGEYLLLP